MKGESDRVLPGNAATVQSDLPFQGLSHFGSNFLSKFNVAFTDSPLVDLFTLIDTPGVLSGDKQRLGRSYDYVKTVEWFAQRSDMILLLFDAHKLDISDEFKSVIEALIGHGDKIRIVLNKADSITTQELMRVYGALMWSLGKIINTPEVMRVYVGSFWNPPEMNDNNNSSNQNKDLIKTEHEDLLNDLKALPKSSAIRKVNDLVKRARFARVHAYIIETLRKELPTFFGRAAKQTKLISNLSEEFTKVHKTFNLPAGDFPDIEKFQESLRNVDLSTFPKLSTKLMTALDEALTIDIPTLLNSFPQDFNDFQSSISKNPFNFERLEHIDESSPDIWMVKAQDRLRYQRIFQNLTNTSKLNGPLAKNFFSDSKLDEFDLAQIWKLSDSDQDGCLTEQEFIIAMHLVFLRLHGIELPQSLSVKQ